MNKLTGVVSGALALAATAAPADPIPFIDAHVHLENPLRADLDAALGDITLLGGLAEPLHGFGLVRRRAPAFESHVAEAEPGDRALRDGAANSAGRPPSNPGAVLANVPQMTTRVLGTGNHPGKVG